MKKYEYDFTDLLNDLPDDKVTLDDIRDVIMNVSIDMVCNNNSLSKFADDAVTYLYSGMVNEYIYSNSVVITLDDVRILDKNRSCISVNKRTI